MPNFMNNSIGFIILEKVNFETQLYDVERRTPAYTLCMHTRSRFENAGIYRFVYSFFFFFFSCTFNAIFQFRVRHGILSKRHDMNDYMLDRYRANE